MLKVLFPLLLGVLHCLETDHILAVATVSSKKQPRLSSLFYQGASWGLGHSIPIVILGVIYAYSSFFLLKNFPFSLEILVGIVLIIVGFLRLYKLYKNNKESKNHNTDVKAMLMIGLLHGFAGSAGIVLGNAAIQSSLTKQLLYFMTFSIGSILGMGLINICLGNMSKWVEKIKKLQWLIPMISILYGAFLIFNFL